MGVDVDDLARLDAGLAHRTLGGADGADATGRGQRDVRRVRRRAISDELGKDRHATGAGMLELLEDDRTGPLTRNETVAALIERP